MAKYGFKHIKNFPFSYSFNRIKKIGSDESRFRRAANRLGLSVEKDAYNKRFIINKKD